MLKPKQCRSNEQLKDLQCQGIPNHEGAHWAYDPGGDLILWKNKKDKDPKWRNIGCMWIPPGAKGYISPEDMYKNYYLNIWANAERKRRRDQRRNAQARKAGE